MSLLLALIIGLLFATGVYMLLRRSFVKIIIGLGLMGHGANLLIITAGGIKNPSLPPLIAKDGKVLSSDAADPLPPALILTAIVISFAIVSYTIVLVKRAYQEIGTDNLDEMRSTDALDT